MPQSAEWDRLVNKVWPAEMPIPSAQEATTGAKRLYRRAMGKPFQGNVVITSGNRYTWVRRRIMSVNPKRRGAWEPKAGWPDIVHLLAHYCHRTKYPNHRPHHYSELEIEADLTRYAVENGFHLGRLKRDKEPKAKPDKRATKLQSAQEALKRWKTKQKRAETAIRKYRQKIRYYEKVS